MRVLGVVGVVVIVAAAWVVPLPRVVERPAGIVAVVDAVTVRLTEQALQAAPEPPPLTGEYLATHRQGRPTVAGMLAAAVSPAQVVHAAPPESDEPLVQPDTVAALRGLGLAPARMEGAALPVDTVVEDSVDPASAAVWLHIFDTVSQLDLAQNRTVAAVGRVPPDESVRCVPDAGAGVEAARRAGADIIVVAADCDDVGQAPDVVRAATVTQAIERLLAR